MSSTEIRIIFGLANRGGHRKGSPHGWRAKPVKATAIIGKPATAVPASTVSCKPSHGSEAKINKQAICPSTKRPSQAKENSNPVNNLARTGRLNGKSTASQSQEINSNATAIVIIRG